MSKLRPLLRPAAALLAAALALTAAPAMAASPPVTAPGDFRVTAVTPGSVTLAWSPSTGDVVGYTVNYHQAFNDVFWSQPLGDVTTVTITGGIAATRQYSFSVYARDSAGLTSPSAPSITVVTPAATTGDTTPPSAPAGLQITEVTADGPRLSWTASTDDTGVADYQVFWFDGWYSSILVGTVTGTTFVAPVRAGGYNRPSYYVRARDAAGNVSIASGTVAAPPVPTTPPTPPARTCRVAYRTTAEWAGGFVAEATVTNTGTTAVNGWSLVYTNGGDQQVSSAWHATAAQSGADVTLTAASWNRTIAPGASVTAGLIGRWTGANTPPTSAALNGSPCALA